MLGTSTVFGLVLPPKPDTEPVKENEYENAKAHESLEHPCQDDEGEE